MDYGQGAVLHWSVGRMLNAHLPFLRHLGRKWVYSKTVDVDCR